VIELIDVQTNCPGCHVIATARRFEVLKELGAMGMTILELDVASQESVLRCKAKVQEITGGRLDILINNA
jgi:1-acylglycerone phosphate reductase